MTRRRSRCCRRWVFPAACLLVCVGGSGQEVRIEGANGDQRHHRVARGADRFYLAWDSWEYCRFHSANSREVDLAGSFKGWDRDVPGGCGLDEPDIAVAATGLSMIVGNWGDGDQGAIGARLFDAAGQPLTPVFIVNQQTQGDQRAPRVAALANGSFAVTWLDMTVGNRGRLVMPDGATPDAEVPMPGGLPLDAAALPGSGLAVAAAVGSGDGLTYDIILRLYDDTLTPTTPEILVAAGGWPASNYGAVVTASPAGMVVAYVRGDPAQGPDPQTLARLFDSGGNARGPSFPVSSRQLVGQIPYGVGMDDTGRFVVLLDDVDTSISPYRQAFARRFAADGRPLSAEFLVNGTTAEGAGGDDLAMLPNGDFVAIWGTQQDKPPSASGFMRRYFFPVSILAAPGPGATNPPDVRAMQPDGLDGYQAFTPYGASGYGANLAAGDIDGDKVFEALTGPGPGPVLGPQVRAFEASGPPLAKVSFYAYGTLRYGVRPGSGDIDGDSFAEILTGAGAGSVFGPHVRAFDYDGAKPAAMPGISFFAYGTPKWGVRAAAGDIDGDGFAELLTAPGPGIIFGSHLRAFDVIGGKPVAKGKVSFFACGNGRYGATVSAADVESDGAGGYGDGFDEILTGVGPDPNPAVTGKACLYDFDNSAIAFKYEITPYATPYGVNVAGGDMDAGDTEEVVTAPGPDPTAPGRILSWEWDPVIGRNPDGPALHRLGPDDFTAFGYGYGANIAVGTF